MEAILQELKNVKQKDTMFDNILGSMCTIPHEIARKAYEMFIGTNLGDYKIFEGTKWLETKAIDWVAKLVHAPTDYGGMLTSGGTESNITALWISKKLSGKGEIIISKHAHFSLIKAASLLGLKLNVINCKYRMNAIDVKRKLTSNTSCVIAAVGNTPFGYIDEIEAIAELCDNENIFFHADAAFGGFIAPYISDKTFDFRTKISSICLDAHKMGMACIPCGFLLLRKKQWLKEIETRSTCTHTKYQTTLLGTRPGSSAASAYAVMHYLGHTGYLKLSTQCLTNTIYMTNLLDLHKIDYVKPELNLIAIKTKNVIKIAQELAKIGWFVGIDEENDVIRIVLMPHVSKDMINNFVVDLKKVIQ
jgi:tyrosine decarboxylase/aspartate 1-decarboxylase